MRKQFEGGQRLWRRWSAVGTITASPAVAAAADSSEERRASFQRIRVPRTYITHEARGSDRILQSFIAAPAAAVATVSAARLQSVQCCCNRRHHRLLYVGLNLQQQQQQSLAIVHVLYKFRLELIWRRIPLDTAMMQCRPNSADFVVAFAAAILD